MVPVSRIRRRPRHLCDQHQSPEGRARRRLQRAAGCSATVTEQKTKEDQKAKEDHKMKEEFTTFAFTCSKPVLPGNFAAAKYILRNSNRGGFTIDFYVKAGDERWADHASDVIGKHLEYYSS